MMAGLDPAIISNRPYRQVGPAFRTGARMAETYWVTFRIHDDATYEHRRDKLYEAIRTVSSKWWIEPTSFITFASNESANAIAFRIKSAFNPNTDLALPGMTDYKTALLIGKSEDSNIFDLIPFLKRV
jgi:hypothetical protein